MTPLDITLGIVTCIGLGWLGYGLMELAGHVTVRLVRK